MWGGWARELGTRLEAAARRPVAPDVFAAIGFDPTTGRAAAGGPLAGATMAQIESIVATVLRRWCPSVAAARRATEAAWFVPDPGAATPAGDVRGVLGRLRDAGMRLAVATTDDRDPTDAALRSLGVRDVVEAIVCGDDGFPIKPAPDAVFAICHALQTEPSRCAVVGDAPSDIAMARAAGVGLVVGVLTGVGRAEDLCRRRCRGRPRSMGSWRRTAEPAPPPPGRPAGTPGLSLRTAPDRTVLLPSRTRTAGPRPAAAWRLVTERWSAPTAAARRHPRPPTRRGPRPSAGSPPRSAGDATWRACSTTSSTRRSGLFGVDRAGLWWYQAGATRPLTMAAQRGLSPEIVEAITDLPGDAPTAGMDALRSRRVRVLDRAMRSTTARLRAVYREIGVQSICYVPLVFGDEVLGLLVLYHREPYDWTRGERALARAFGDHMATAIGGARLADSRRSLADRLTSIAELSSRLSGLRDPGAIARAIVEEAKRLIRHDTLRVYRVDHASGTCEPIAFEGTFLGQTNPDLATLRVKVGEGLTGWVAASGRSIRLGDAAADPRVVILSEQAEPESMLVVPMIHEGVVQGVMVASVIGRDRFDADDEVTLSIYAAAAVQALIAAEHVERLHRQQQELEHQLDGQRRLLDVNERLLSTLEPAAILELIADSLKAIVPYDSLTIYEVDRTTGVRRALIARDAFADEILAHEFPLGEGISGWVIERGQAVLANEAHLDARSVQVPGTPFEPEAMIVVPLLVKGATVGTLNVGRMGDSGVGFSENEFELTKLFAGQASIAMQNAAAHGEVRVRAEQDALTGLRNHGAFQHDVRAAVAAGAPFAVLMMDLDAFKVFNDALGHPAGDALLVEVGLAMTGATRDTDQLYRYGGDEFAAILHGADRVVAHDVGGRIRRAVRDRTDRLAASGVESRPVVSVSVGIACFPDDGRSNDELIAVADRALYQVKPVDRRSASGAHADPFLQALDETAIALLDRHDQAGLLQTIVGRASTLLGSAHAFVDLVEPDGSAIVLRHATGLFSPLLGLRLQPDDGLSAEVIRHGRPLVIDDYDEWSRRSAQIPVGVMGAVVAVPLTSGGRPIGVLGLSSTDTGRRWTDRDVDALTSFAKLASIGLDNARLVDVAQRGALYDATTGLPNRELLTDRIAHALAGRRQGEAVDRGGAARPGSVQGDQREPGSCGR